MRVLRAAPELIMWALIIAVAIFNVALFSGVVLGEDAIDVRTVDATSDEDGDSPRARAVRAEHDDSGDLPGTFVPTQGRQHVAEGEQVPFCEPGRVREDCYASNPPTSGLHVPVQRAATLADGNIVNIPPDPGVYDFAIPRESIPHIQEHAGVFVGYNCASAACSGAVEAITDAVLQQLELGARVVMAPSSDLPADTIGLAAWTRFDTFTPAGYTEDRVLSFIKAHSCRFDPEAFCEPEAPEPEGDA